jgi:hypothetical protein
MDKEDREREGKKRKIIERKSKIKNKKVIWIFHRYK